MIRSRFDVVAQELFLSYDTGAIYEVGYTIAEYIESAWGGEAFIVLIGSNGDFSFLTDKTMNEIFLNWKIFVNKKYFVGPKL